MSTALASQDAAFSSSHTRSVNTTLAHISGTATQDDVAHDGTLDERIVLEQQEGPITYQWRAYQRKGRTRAHACNTTGCKQVPSMT